MVDAGSQWYDPTGGVGKITNQYGVQKSYYSRGGHTGVDYAAPANSAAYSISNGKVIAAGYDPTVGNYVKIDYGNGRAATYAHLNKVNVKAGDSVTGGAAIGLIGNTGSSSRGSHAHLEYTMGGQYVSPESFYGGADKVPAFARGSYASTKGLGQEFSYKGMPTITGSGNVSVGATGASGSVGTSKPSGPRLTSSGSSQNVVRKIY